jgi:hypothetical protein
VLIEEKTVKKYVSASLLIIATTLNGMQQPETQAEEHMRRAVWEIATMVEQLRTTSDARLCTLEDQLSRSEHAYHELKSQHSALQNYLTTLATIQANHAREAERSDIQKQLHKVKRAHKDLQQILQGKKLTPETQKKLARFEQLTAERSILQDKLQALDESDQG